MRKLAAGFAQQFPLIASLVTTRLRVTLTVAAIVWGVMAYGMFAQTIATSEGLFTQQGPMIGGDFVVFRTAASVVGTPEMTTIYSMENLSAKLRGMYPGHGGMKLGWQYPPTMYLLVRPLALLPHVASFFLWVGACGGLLVATLFALWPNRGAILFAVASPAVFWSIATGQTGLLTGALVALSAGFARERPVIAGVAAGVLTVKPQLGLLIPLAFAAAGCWRAFTVAAITALALVGVSVAAFGIEPWHAFLGALTAHGERLDSLASFPFYKLVTPFGAARMFGLPAAAGMPVQAVASLALAVYVIVVWRRAQDVDVRLAALATAVLLATPYAFYYEMALLVPPMFVVARRGLQQGWLPGERLSLIVIWVASLWPPGEPAIPGFPVSFAVALGAFLIAARRAWPAMHAPGTAHALA